MNKHTPGPWKTCTTYKDTQKGIVCVSTWADQRNTLAKFRAPSGGAIGETIANAERAVLCVNACEGINPVAVPDLLEACKRAVHLYDHDDATSVLEWVNSPEFRAAIAKAEGGAA